VKITIAQGAFMPVPPILGTSVEKIWFALGKEFVRRGHEVVHISRRHPSLENNERIEGVEHIRIPGFDVPSSLVTLKYRDLRYSIRALRHLPPADLLVTNTFWLPLLAPKTSRGKIYVHIARYPRGQMKFYRKAARLQPVSNVISRAVCREAPELARRVKVIPNFVSRDAQPGADCPREKCLLYVGRLHPEKGVHFLIDAFKRILASGFKDWTLRVIGPWEVPFGGGGEEYFKSLRERSRDIDGSVDWVGPVFDAEALTNHYRRSSLFVYPSIAGKGEASPLAPLEAMAEGCPTIVSSLECFRDYLRPGSNGWTFDETAPDTAAELAATLTLAMSDDEKITAARKDALTTADRFSLANVASAYLQDFQEVLAS
jgi:glycosyltransferase involved in cell wall biosynthesis